MRKIKLYITASLDNYIAPPDGDIDWLVDCSRPSKEDYKTFYDSVNTVIISGNTYHNMFCMDILLPYKDKTIYVVTRNSMIERDNINFITENVIEKIARLKEEKGKDIWLVGGGGLTALLHEHNLIDEIIVTHISETLGSGIPLFSDKLKEADWVLKEQVSYDNNAGMKVYQPA